MDIIKTILELDPHPYYSRIEVNPYKRRQKIFMKDLFPNEKKICACGCAKTLDGRKSRWFSKECQTIPLQIFFIIQGDVDTIAKYVRARDGDKCKHCQRTWNDIWESLEGKDLTLDQRARMCCLELDHIVPVWKGGGGSWLNNYQFLCNGCHKIKTKADRASEQDIDSNP
jgi:hypothetical protein